MREPKIHPLIRHAKRKQLYKFLKEGWSEQGKREIFAEIARRKKRHGSRTTKHDRGEDNLATEPAREEAGSQPSSQ